MSPGRNEVVEKCEQNIELLEGKLVKYKSAFKNASLEDKIAIHQAIEDVQTDIEYNRRTIRAEVFDYFPIPHDSAWFKTPDGKVFRAPPGTNFIDVHDAGRDNGRVNIPGIKAALGHFGTLQAVVNQQTENSSGESLGRKTI